MYSDNVLLLLCQFTNALTVRQYRICDSIIYINSSVILKTTYRYTFFVNNRNNSEVK